MIWRLKTFSTCNISWTLIIQVSSLHSSYSNSSNTCSNTCSYFSCGTILKYFFSSFVSVLWSICFLVSETLPIEETGTIIVSGRSDCPITGEERRRKERMMSRFFTEFPISGLVLPKLYQNMWCFSRMWGIWLCEL